MRRLLVVGLVLMLAACATPPGLDRARWDSYQSRFVSPEGRVIDTGNDGVSHSEGQGVAMLLAVAFDDRARFDQLWRWTQTHLQVRGDRLFAWRWSPGEGIKDRNNASDGDILIAWALYRAAVRWQQPFYRREADAVTNDIRSLLLRRSQYGLLLLPGAEGFVNEQGTVVNLSYWIFPAFRELADITHAAEWTELEKSGLQLLAMARFGRWQLPPDWLQVGEQFAPAAPFAPRFSYDAVRIPLYLLWSGDADDKLMQPYVDFWGYFADAPFVPAWTNLQDNSIDSYDAPPGFHAVMRLLAERVRTARVPTRLAAAGTKEDYYSASLAMLAHMAQVERGVR